MWGRWGWGVVRRAAWEGLGRLCFLLPPSLHLALPPGPHLASASPAPMELSAVCQAFRRSELQQHFEEVVYCYPGQG